MMKPDKDGPMSVEARYTDYHAWKSWDDLFVYTREHSGYFKGEFRDVRIKGAKVLEIGFGSGACLAWLKDWGASVYGTEISDISRNAAEANGVTVLPADLTLALDAHAGTFDTVIALDVFEHLSIEEIGDALTALEGLLKVGGRVVLRFPNAQSPFGLQPQMGDPTHRSALSRNVFRLLIANRALTVVRYSPSFRYLGRSFRKIVIRSVRNALRVMISGFLNAVYCARIPYDPVVVLVLERTAAQKAKQQASHAGTGN